MRDEYRWLLAFALSMAILFGWQAYFGPQTPPGEGAPTADAPAPSAGDAPDRPAAATAEGEPDPAPAAEAAAPAGSAAAATAPLPADLPTLKLENDRLALTVAGNQVTRWRLKGYRVDQDPDSELVDLCADKPAPCAGFGFAGLGPPDSLRRLGDGARGLEAAWNAGGGRLLAQLRVLPNSRVGIQFATEGAPRDVRFQPYVRLSSDMPESASAYIFSGLRFRRAGSVESVDFEDLDPEHRWEGRFDWAMWDLKYFGRAIFPPAEEVEVRVTTERPGPDEDPTAGVLEMRSTPLKLRGEDVDPVEFGIFGGPKDIALLRQVGNGLQESIDFGWTAVLGRPLLSLLHLFEKGVGNYGFAIILLTLVIKIILYPLTSKSYRSMQAMSKLKPKMEEIQKEHKGDPQRLNQEMLSLYREEKVNPLGGCLPMLLQIPIFFALYTVLLVSIELRHAPFALWIQDLSSPENLITLTLMGFDAPVRVLPLVMGATMYLQQKLTPATVDPAQQKLFTLMPIMFTFLFYGFPSGLVLYWLTNNVVTIGQQWWIQRQLKQEG